MEKMRARLLEEVSSGGFYEAHESYKTMFHRLRTKKKLDEGCDVLVEGASALLLHGHVRCAEELVLLMIEHYVRDSMRKDAKNVERIDGFLVDMPRTRTEPEQVKNDALPIHADAGLKIISSSLKWIESQEKKKDEDEDETYVKDVIARWHQWIATFLWDTVGWSMLAEESAHFARAHAPRDFAKVLLEVSKEGKKEDTDIVCVRGMLEMLLAGEFDDAEEMRLAFVSGLEDPNLMETPLGQFGKFSITALKRKSKELFRMLCQKYQNDIQREKGLKTLCNRIVQVHFGGGDNPMGMLGGLMKAMMA